MKKKFLFILSFLLLFTSVYASERKKMTLVINNIVFEKDFVVKNDRIHIPLRLVSENLGADVIWKGDTRQVEIINKGKKIVFYIDSKEYRIDDMVFTIDSPTFILNDTAYVPARALANAMNAKLEWNEKEFYCSINNGYERDVTREPDPLKDGKDLALINKIRKVTDLGDYLRDGVIKVEEVQDGKVYELFLKDYEKKNLSMRFIFDKNNNLKFYKFDYFPNEKYPFLKKHLSEDESRKVAREFMNLVGNKKRFLKDKELSKDQRDYLPDAGTYVFYTKSGEVTVDASGGFVYTYSKN
ncbi:copper amine oxidase N-terminal domain-containing protein [Peptoniphilus genitalis]|uniref:Copper amine oxidase N-terminal domain-containing protein n=1 Tax=Peptoniphilus genitalis TaxID=3036303 RepID=A0ABY4TLU8_9FIRM|nr:copper amine oxidase N-terminal domain-containing protein [Peptoniphilus sp. SAHP1]URN40947.1 copper amine oxidase N-terminal domain-containing protein [Peptoniphilus sp. SAHP1]